MKLEIMHLAKINDLTIKSKDFTEKNFVANSLSFKLDKTCSVDMNFEVNNQDFLSYYNE